MSRIPIVLLLLVAGCSHVAQEQCACASPPAVPNQALAPSTAVSRGVIRGVVIDSVTGRPMSGASLIWEPGRASAISGRNGEFTLVGVPVGPGRLRGRLIGYHEWAEDGMMTEANGLAARIAVQEFVLPQCEAVRPITGIGVTVRDAVEGGPPQGTVRVEVREGAYSEAAEFNGEPELVGGLLELARGRPGRYAVRVIGARYRPWTANAVELKMGPCGWTNGIMLAVWLIPM